MYLLIIFVLLAKQFFMTIRISQMDSKLRSLAQKVALNEEKIERERGRASGALHGGSGGRQNGGPQNAPGGGEEDRPAY